MSEGFYNELGELIDRHRQADTRQADQAAANERFDALNSKLDSIAETVTKFAQSSAPSEPPGDGRGTGEGQTDGAADPPPDPAATPPEPELPFEVVTRLGVPRIYTGDDEPTEVKYIDPETGEERTRQGRRKNHPAAYSVEPYEEPTPAA